MNLLLQPKILQHDPKLLAREGIERAERLVEQQQFRLMDQRAAERRALLHAAGQLPGVMIGEAVEPDDREQFARLLPIKTTLATETGWHAARRSQAAGERCRGRAPRQHDRILERHADDAERRRDFAVRDDDAAAGREVEGPKRASAASTSHSRTGRRPRRTRPCRSKRCVFKRERASGGAAAISQADVGYVDEWLHRRIRAACGRRRPAR